MEDFVTQQQFGELMAEMRAGFAEVKGLIGELKQEHKAEVACKQQEYDQRYRLAELKLPETLAILDEPSVRKKAFQIIDEYMRTPDAERSIAEVQRSILRTGRDETFKWISLIKVIAGVIAAGVTVYFGVSINQIASAIAKLQ